MVTEQMRRSYPFLAYALEQGVDYGEVLATATWVIHGRYCPGTRTLSTRHYASVCQIAEQEVRRRNAPEENSA